MDCDDYARQQLNEYGHYKKICSASVENIDNPDFDGKIIENEKIFSKEYEDNQEKEKQKDGCKEG